MNVYHLTRCSSLISSRTPRLDNTSPLSLLNFFEEKYFVEKKNIAVAREDFPLVDSYIPRAKKPTESPSPR